MVEPCVCGSGRSGGRPCASPMGIMPSGARANVRLIYHRVQRCLALERIQWLSYVSRGSDLPRQMVGGFCNLNGWRCVVRRRLQIRATVWFWGSYVAGAVTGSSIGARQLQVWWPSIYPTVQGCTFTIKMRKPQSLFIFFACSVCIINT